MKKFILAFLISIIPLENFRRILYRLMLHYYIPKTSRIGFLTVIAVSDFSLGQNVMIGPLNLFKGPMSVKIGSNSRLGKCNKFTCANHIVQDRFKSMNYTPIIEFGDSILVTDNHFFDVFGKITIGNGTWVAGHGSEFWTHGLSVRDRDITIGEKNYIGSAVRFAPGTSIGNNNIVALSSVLMSKLICNAYLISGFPAKPFRSIEEDLKKGKYRFSFEDWSN
jgi:acetyltransferase-like isoleucine patch superfamily enzyme